jgi:hypothetical protein
MAQFFETRMGQKFFESTMPDLVRQLTRLNDLLERIAAKIEGHTYTTPTP